MIKETLFATEKREAKLDRCPFLAHETQDSKTKKTRYLDLSDINSYHSAC